MKSPEGVFPSSKLSHSRIAGTMIPSRQTEMKAMNDDDFPSSFDLWFDIKSREDLVRLYAEHKQEISQIERVMADHGMAFTEEEMKTVQSDWDVEIEPPTPR